MSLFVIADLHLSLGVDKPMDIFGGWDNYVQRLEENWQRLVSPDDTVVIPGDISWGMNLEQSKADFDFINRLNGRKIISKGNHDYFWNSRKKMEDFFQANGFDTLHIMHNNCFEYEGIGICGSRGWINETGDPDDVKVLKREAQRLEVSITAAEIQGLVPVVFLHYPPVFADSVNVEIFDVLMKHNIRYCFYGHLHGGVAHSKSVNGLYNGIQMRLVSADYLKFVPLDITNIVQSAKI
ncbi:metallophosphoesterase [Ruminococcus sp. NK3A76]|uniref:metallophosphoesterase n=1 Tax=Ruminococcus sp. NK3A76 TaxID=877411 RepID=UPI00048E39A7|nr:metallophosphoesterase [Ruminococcus sp. NK3A76]